MKALVIVHAEEFFVNPRRVGNDRAPKIRKAFDNLAHAIPGYLNNDYPVYFLAQEARTSDSEFIYRGIRPFMQYIQFFAAESTAGREDLQVKEDLMAKAIDEIVLAGVSRIQCVASMLEILSGRNKSPPGTQYWAYEKVARELEWDEKKFWCIYRAHLPVHIDEELSAV